MKGWNDPVFGEVKPFTYVSGLWERATGAYPFNLGAKWVGGKSKIAGTTQMNFVTTNDIIGGNSGSPVLERDGRIVGLAFDGNIHSTGGAYGFDPALNRYVAVSSQLIVGGTAQDLRRQGAGRRTRTKNRSVSNKGAAGACSNCQPVGLGQCPGHHWRVRHRGIAWLLSENKRKFPWLIVLGAIVMMYVFTLLLFGVPIIRAGLDSVNDGINVLIAATREGTKFVFGPIIGDQAAWEKLVGTPGPIFIFQLLPLIIVIGSLSAILWHWGILKASREASRSSSSAPWAWAGRPACRSRPTSSWARPKPRC